jgi:hypothetical protein
MPSDTDRVTVPCKSCKRVALSFDGPTARVSHDRARLWLAFMPFEWKQLVRGSLEALVAALVESGDVLCRECTP